MDGVEAVFASLGVVLVLGLVIVLAFVLLKGRW